MRRAEPSAEKIVVPIVWGLGLVGAGIASFFTLRAAGLLGELPRASGGDVLVDMFTMASTKENFVRGMLSAATQARPGLSFEARKLIAAWAAYESGWGKTKQAKMGFNVFNISKGAWTGPTMSGGDTEFTEGQAGSKVIVQQWRVYSGLPAGVNDLLNLLEKSRYVNYREAYGALLAGDPTFGTRLGVFETGADGKIVKVETRPDTAGYYTLPRSQYQSSMSKLYAEVSKIASAAGLNGLNS